jgi:hypothetical protein
MSITASGLHWPTMRDIFDSSQLLVDLELETHKIALFSDACTPNFSTDAEYAAGNYATNEVTGTGWATGGVVVPTTQIDESPAGTLRWDADDIVAGGTTLATGVKGGLIYTVALKAIVLVAFASAVTTDAGTFTITWQSTGILAWDFTP